MTFPISLYRWCVSRATVKLITWVFFCIWNSTFRHLLVNSLKMAGDVLRWVHKQARSLLGLCGVCTSFPYFPSPHFYVEWQQIHLGRDSRYFGGHYCVTMLSDGCFQTICILRRLPNAQVHLCPPPSEEEGYLPPFCAMFHLLGTTMASLYLCAPKNLWIKAPSTWVPRPCQPHHRHPAVVPIPLFLFLCSLPQLRPLQPVQTTHINKHTLGQLSRHVWIPVSASVWAHIAV